MDFHERQHSYFHEDILRTHPVLTYTRRFSGVFHEDILRTHPDITRRFSVVKHFILSKLEENYTLNHILGDLNYPYRITSSPCEFSYMLCKWGLFREHWDYSPVHEDQVEINQIAQDWANNMSFEEAARLWDGPNWDWTDAPSTTLFLRNKNPLATVLLLKANAEYRAEKQTVRAGSSLRDPTSNSISELPRQPDRKACMTCGERVDGVTYCSKQCRPSASLEWYSHSSNRGATLTITEGFCTARSRFTSPSADSCATYDTTQFVPPPYGLVDANPPTPKFVPTKEEPQEGRGIEELPL